MGWFNNRKEEVIDYTDYQHRMPAKKAHVSPTSNSLILSSSSASSFSQPQVAKPVEQEESGGFLGFFGNIASSQSSSSSNSSTNDDSKTQKHLTVMTNRCEELSNQIYRLEQRLEVLEQKLRTGRGF